MMEDIKKLYAYVQAVNTYLRLGLRGVQSVSVLLSLLDQRNLLSEPELGLEARCRRERERKMRIPLATSGDLTPLLRLTPQALAPPPPPPPPPPFSSCSSPRGPAGWRLRRRLSLSSSPAAAALSWRSLLFSLRSSTSAALNNELLKQLQLGTQRG